MGQGKEHLVLQWHHRSRGSSDHPVDCARAAEAHCDCHRTGERGQQVWHLSIRLFRLEIIHWPIIFRFQSRQFDHINRILPDIPMDLPNRNHRFRDRRWTVFGISGQSSQSNCAYAKRFEMSMLWRGHTLQGWSELWSIDLQCILPRYIAIIVYLYWQCTNGGHLQNCRLRFQRDSKWQDCPLLPGEQSVAKNSVGCEILNFYFRRRSMCLVSFGRFSLSRLWVKWCWRPRSQLGIGLSINRMCRTSRWRSDLDVPYGKLSWHFQRVADSRELT